MNFFFTSFFSFTFTHTGPRYTYAQAAAAAPVYTAQTDVSIYSFTAIAAASYSSPQSVTQTLLSRNRTLTHTATKSQPLTFHRQWGQSHLLICFLRWKTQTQVRPRFDDRKCAKQNSSFPIYFNRRLVTIPKVEWKIQFYTRTPDICMRFSIISSQIDSEPVPNIHTYSMAVECQCQHWNHEITRVCVLMSYRGAQSEWSCSVRNCLIFQFVLHGTATCQSAIKSQNFTSEVNVFIDDHCMSERRTERRRNRKKTKTICLHCILRPEFVAVSIQLHLAGNSCSIRIRFGQ